jgi:hypothetical protein
MQVAYIFLSLHWCVNHVSKFEEQNCEMQNVKTQLNVDGICFNQYNFLLLDQPTGLSLKQ